MKYGTISFIAIALLGAGSANAQNPLSDILNAVTTIRKTIQESTPDARVPGSYVTMQTAIQDGVQTTTVAFDPRLQSRLVRNARDPRHATAANDAMTFALGQGTLYNNQPEPPAPPEPEPAPPPAPIVPLATSSAIGQ